MRAWSIILGVVIFLCVVSVSFSHTVDLYKRVGFALWESVVFTIAVETTFFLSAWTILWRRNKGEKPSGSAYAGFTYGVVLVFFSNSAYTVGLNRLFENDIAQWVLALSVVLGVLIAESIISQNLAELHRENGERRLQHDGGWSLQGKEKVEEMEMETEKISTPSDISIPSTPSKNLSITTTTSTPSNSILSNSSTLSTLTMEKKRVEVEKAKSREENHQEVEENRSRTLEKVEAGKAARKALEIYEREGELPGRRRLMEEAGVSEWEARKTLQELRRKVG